MTSDDSFQDIKLFQKKIQYQKDQLFGIELFFQIISKTYEKDTSIVGMNRRHFESIKERTEKAIALAETLLEKSKIDKNLTKSVLDFEFPPTSGNPILDSVTKRAQILAKEYETLFPNRLRSLPLSEYELELLHVSAVEKFIQKE